MFKRGFLNKTPSSTSDRRPTVAESPTKSTSGPAVDTASSAVGTTAAERKNTGTDNINVVFKRGQRASGTQPRPFPATITGVGAASNPCANYSTLVRNLCTSRGDGQDLVVFTTLPGTPCGDPVVCVIPPNLERLIKDTAGFPSLPPVPIGEVPLHRIVDMTSAGKGLGVVATRFIKAGELVLAERPLLVNLTGPPTSLITAMIAPYYRAVCQTQELVDVLTAQKQAEFEDWALDCMTPEARDAFKALDDCGTGICSTNSFELIEILPGGTSDGVSEQAMPGGVCKDSSRLNHSCMPNTRRYFDVPSFSYQFFAARDIPEGEEITTAYTNTSEKTSERKSILSERYAFDCTCLRCMKSPVSDTSFLAFTQTVGRNCAILFDEKFTNNQILFRDCTIAVVGLETMGLQAEQTYKYALEMAIIMCQMLGDTVNANKYMNSYTALLYVWLVTGPDKDPEVAARVKRSFVERTRTELHATAPWWKVRSDDGGKEGSWRVRFKQFARENRELLAKNAVPTNWRIFHDWIVGCTM